MLEYIPGKVFVVTVLSLICFIAYSPQFFIYLRVYEFSEIIYLLVPFNLLIFMVFYNYYLAVTTDPGKIPPNWVS
jgi:palmitoyltransferase